MAKNLPWEIIVDILCRLPANDLLRYRSVSKPWRNLIDGPDFIKLHFNHSSKTRVVFGGRNDLFWVDPEALDSPQRLSFPIDIGDGIDIFGGCNGLIALQNTAADCAIWNPTTRKHRIVPNFLSDMERYPLLAVASITHLGFGHDPIGDDYKVMRLVNYEAPGRAVHSVAKVYSLKANAWRRVGDFPSHFKYDRRNGRLVGTALHWIVTRISDDSDAILAFDLVGEEHHEVPLPDMDLSVIKNPCTRLANLGGRLCVTMLGEYDGLLRRTARADMWVMMENGVKESWTKLFSVAPSLTAAPSFGFVEPVMYFKDENRILLNWDSDMFVVYDLKRKRIRKVKGSYISPIIDTHVCATSLVGVGGESSGKRAEESRKKLGEKQKQKKELSGNKKRDDFLSKGFKLVL